MGRKILLGLGALLVVGVIGVFVYVPGHIEAGQNVVLPHESYAVSGYARSLHGALAIADLHADTLLWHRDPLARGTRGHVDLPRLREGNVALQIFAVVTKVPAGLNYEENTGDSDRITQLAMVQRWPVKTWNSLYQRALYQASRLHRAEAESAGALRIVRTAADFADVLTARANGEDVTAALLATEGAHPLEGDLSKVQTLYDADYRMMGLHHFFDNRLGGSLHGVSGSGLTEFGRNVVQEMERIGMIIDVAHSSVKVVEDVLDMSVSPLVVSHTGVYGACESARNIPDELMQRIAAGGGLIGIGYWDGAVCDPSPISVVASIRYAMELVGVDHVALGSDYDGATSVLFDASELAILTEIMLRENFTETEIRAVMGANAVRFFTSQLAEQVLMP